MTAEIGRLQEALRMVKAAQVEPQLDNEPSPLMNSVGHIFGYLLFSSTLRFWPDRHLENALAMVKGKVGYASIAFHTSGLMDAWAGPQTASRLARYAHGRTRPSLLVLEAGLLALIAMAEDATRPVADRVGA